MMLFVIAFLFGLIALWFALRIVGWVAWRVVRAVPVLVVFVAVVVAVWATSR